MSRTITIELTKQGDIGWAARLVDGPAEVVGRDYTQAGAVRELMDACENKRGEVTP